MDCVSGSAAIKVMEYARQYKRYHIALSDIHIHNARANIEDVRQETLVLIWLEPATGISPQYLSQWSCAGEEKLN